MRKIPLLLFLVLIMSFSVFAVASGNIQGVGDLVINNFGNVTVINDSVWESNGSTVTLRVPTGIVHIESIFTNITGNISVASVDIRSKKSLSFDRGAFTLSATDFIFLTGGTRRSLVSDADFQVQHNTTGSAYLTVQNMFIGPQAKAGIGGISGDGVGFLSLKSSSLALEPHILESNNNAGNWDIIAGPLEPNPTQPFPVGEIKIGFYNNFSLDENLSVTAYNGKIYSMIINYTNGITINTDLTLNGNLFTNKIFAELYFPENGDLNVTISSINTYYNITPLYNGYNYSIGLDTSTFIIQETGTYFGTYTGSMKDGSTSDFGLAMFVNNQEQNRTHAHFTTLTSNRYTNFAGQGTFSAIQGDIVNLRVQDEKSPASDADFNNVNFVIERIGN